MSAPLDIYTLWITRKSCSDSPPELLVAWDEYGIEENYRGWREACDAALAACGGDVHAERYITLRVPQAAIDKAFAMPVVDATVVGERPS